MPKTLVPLQSADVVAYETFKETENGILDDHKFRPLRKSALDLFRPEEVNRFQYWDAARLAEWLRKLRERIARGEPSGPDPI